MPGRARHSCSTAWACRSRMSTSAPPLAGEWRLGRGITHLILPVGLNILLLLRQVRSSFPDATVLAVGEFSAIDRRIHAYMAGADNCLSAQAGPEELAAVLQAIRRRGADARRVDMAQAVAVARADEDGGRQGVWVLSDGGWMLAAADGTRIDLRKSERTLLQWFAHHEGWRRGATTRYRPPMAPASPGAGSTW